MFGTSWASEARVKESLACSSLWLTSSPTCTAVGAPGHPGHLGVQLPEEGGETGEEHPAVHLPRPPPQQEGGGGGGGGAGGGVEHQQGEEQGEEGRGAPLGSAVHLEEVEGGEERRW